MAKIAKLDAQVGIQTSPDKFFDFFKNNLHSLVQIFPQNVKHFEVLGGGGIKTGSVTNWKYNVTGKRSTILLSLPLSKIHHKTFENFFE